MTVCLRNSMIAFFAVSISRQLKMLVDLWNSKGVSSYFGAHGTRRIAVSTTHID